MRTINLHICLVYKRAICSPHSLHLGGHSLRIRPRQHITGIGHGQLSYEMYHHSTVCSRRFCVDLFCLVGFRTMQAGWFWRAKDNQWNFIIATLWQRKCFLCKLASGGHSPCGISWGPPGIVHYSFRVFMNGAFIWVCTCASIHLSQSLCWRTVMSAPLLLKHTVVIACLNSEVLVPSILIWPITALTAVVTLSCVVFCQGVESVLLTGQVCLFWTSCSIACTSKRKGWFYPFGCSVDCGGYCFDSVGPELSCGPVCLWK